MRKVMTSRGVLFLALFLILAGVVILGVSMARDENGGTSIC